MTTRRSPPRAQPILALTVLGVLLLAAAGSVYRVPAGEIAARDRSLHLAGWHLRPPFAALRRLPLSGRLAGIDVDRSTPEGASIRVRLTLEYELRPGALAAHAGTLAAGGLERLVRATVDGALAPLPTAALLPPDLATPAVGTGIGAPPLPPEALGAIETALRLAGVEPLSLHARAGPAASFPDRAPAGAGSATAGGSTFPAPRSTGLRLLVIGLDGADWDIIDPLVRQGRMPFVAKLIAAGARAPLRSYDPMISPLLWTTMATGVGPDVHGVADFQALDAATGRRVPITSRFRKAPALWNILTGAGLTSGFVGWWASYPAETVDGYQVTNLVAFESLRRRGPDSPLPAGLTYPPGYYGEIAPRLMSVADLGYDQVRSMLHVSREAFETARREALRPPSDDEDRERRRMAQDPLPLGLTILTGSANYALIAADLAARHLDLTAVYFEGIDMIGHRFQHCMPPRMAICPEADYTRFKDAVAGFYERQDRLIGSVLEAAGQGATVMLVSDHGFKTGAGRPSEVLPYTTQQPVEWHDEEGIFLLSGPGARAGHRLVARPTLFDIAPTLLYLTGLPVAETMTGRVLTEALDPAFVQEHSVRSVPSYDGAPRGIAESGGPGARQAEDELLAHLRALGYIGGDGGGTTGGRAATGGAGDASGAATMAGGAPGGRTGEAKSPGSAEETQVFYHRNLATYFMKRREYGHAVEQLLLANERQKLPKTYQMLSECYLAMGRVEEAVDILHEGLGILENMDPESVLWLVRLRLGGDGGGRAAAREYETYRSRTRERPGLDAAIEGLLKEHDGATQEATRLYRRSLAADPTRVPAAQRLYALLPPAGRGAAIEPILRRALAKDARIDEYHNMLGAILAESGRGAEALESFRRAVDLDADNTRFAANLGAALARAGRWSEAAQAYERAASLDASPSIYMRLGTVYRSLRQPERALGAFERARALGENGSGPLLGIALARAEMDQVGRALEVVRQGLDDHPGDPALRSLYEDLLRKPRNPGSAPGPPGSG